MSKVLLLGNDLHLLETRAAVLRKTGASVVCCDAEDAVGMLALDTFDLVVFCHTIFDDDAQRLSHEIHRQWPQVKILQVISDVMREKFYKGVELNATSVAEPGELLRRTTELLAGQGIHATDRGLQDGDRNVPARARSVVDGVEDGAILEEYYRGRLLRSIDREGVRLLGRDHQKR
jgi:DNA-binding response OmpR family regulator